MKNGRTSGQHGPKHKGGASVSYTHLDVYKRQQLAFEKAKFYEQYKEAKEELLKLKTAKQNVAYFFREEEPAQQEG